METNVRVPAGDAELAGTLVLDDSLSERDVRAVVVLCQLVMEPRATMLSRLRWAAARYRHEGAALFCFDHRGQGDSTGAPDTGAIETDRAAVTAFLQRRLPSAPVLFRGWPTQRGAWAVHWVRIPPGVSLPLFEYPASGPERLGTLLFASSSPEWSPLHDALAQRLAATGYTVVGHSAVEVPERICAATFAPATVEQFLAAHEVIWPTAQAIGRDPRPLVLLGHSAGSSGNLLLAAFVGPDSPFAGLRGRARGVIGFGNSGNLGFSRGFSGSVDPEAWRLEPHLPRVTIPVSLYQGDQDFFPPSELEPLVKLLPGEPNRWVLPGADHEFSGRLEELVWLVLEGLRWTEAENTRLHAAR